MAINKTNINEIEEAFAKLDLALICEEKYNSLKQFDWVVYAILKNQESLSKRSYLMGNKSYVDKNNNVFIRISQKKLAKLLKTSEPTLRKSLHRLEDVELLEINVVGKNECNIMYVGNPVRTITFGEYAESIGKSLEEEKEEFVPSINVDKVEDFTRNKKASSTAIDEAHKTNSNSNLNNSRNSIPQNNKKYTKNKKQSSIYMANMKIDGKNFDELSEDYINKKVEEKNKFVPSDKNWLDKNNFSNKENIKLTNNFE